MGTKKSFSHKKNGEEIVNYQRRRTRGKKLAPGNMTIQGRPAFYAYEYTDKQLPESIPILNSPGGWWMSKYKLEKLIDAFRMDCTKAEACYFAGISVNQLQTFIDKHPYFKEVIDHCKQELGYHARKNLARDIKVRKSSTVSREYLNKKDHKLTPAGKLGLPSGNSLLQNNGIIFMDFSNPDQKEPELIDPSKVHVIDEDNAKS